MLLSLMLNASYIHALAWLHSEDLAFNVGTEEQCTSIDSTRHERRHEMPHALPSFLNHLVDIRSTVHLPSGAFHARTHSPTLSFCTCGASRAQSTK